MKTNDSCINRKPFQDVQEENWQRMTLMDKFKSSYRGDYVDNRTSRAAEVLSIFYFWFISALELYCFIWFIIPQYFHHESYLINLSFKLFVIFVYVESVINWFCTRLNTSVIEGDIRGTVMGIYKPEDDVIIPDVGKSSGLKGLTWRWCDICNFKLPPRAHHCKICDRCILKRDHHCFMTGVCIGFRNQKYFIILNVYIAIASIGGMLFIGHYMLNYSPFTSYWDYFLPNTLYSCFFGSLEFKYVLFTIQLYTLWWTAGVAVGFVSMQMYAIVQGKTTHEVKKGVTIRCSASVRENMVSVFGPNWMLGFLFPAERLFKQPGNGIQWRKLTAYIVKKPVRR